jgi:hypothetical protein
MLALGEVDLQPQSTAVSAANLSLITMLSMNKRPS